MSTNTDRATKVLDVSTGYKPRKVQEYIHRHLKRFNVIVAHRRLGKTVLCVNEMVDQGMKCTHKNPQIAYLAPTYGMAKRISWDYIKDAVKNYPYKNIHEHDLRIDLERPDRGDRVRIMLLGADNINALRGLYLDLAVLDEFSEMNPEVWSHVVRPALADREGGAIFIGTPKGLNSFYDMYQHAINDKTGRWFAAMFRASETKVVPQLELDEAKAIMGEDAYNQEFECSWSASFVGSYFGKSIEKMEKEGRICVVPHDPSFNVGTYWDLGISDSMAIWFVQRINGKYFVIDHYENNGVGLEHYVKVLSEKPYIYSNHDLPHDGNIRDLTSGETRREALYKMGLKNIFVQPKHMKRDSIDAARRALDIAYFDKEKCKKGIEALRNYKRQWDAERKVFSNTPTHDWSSHSADAWQCFSMSARKNLTGNEPRHTMAITDYDIFER